jgi:hypothetical protein
MANTAQVVRAPAGDPPALRNSAAGAGVVFPDLARRPPRWLVVGGLVAYCGAIWALVIAGAVTGIQFVIFALS